MYRQLNIILVLITIVSLITFFTAQISFGNTPSVLGVSTPGTKVYDDGNGTLYIEYGNPIEVYNSLSLWQGRYPGRSIYSSSALVDQSSKTRGVIFTYIGK